MIETTTPPGKTKSNHLENALVTICGHPREFTIKHQALNWLMFFAIVLYTLNGYENTLLGLSPTWELYIVSALLAGGYYLVRVKKSFASFFSFVLIGTTFLLSFPAWFSSEGIDGSVPIYMILAILVAMTIFEGRTRTLFVILELLQFAVLTVLQLSHPQWIQSYPSLSSKYFDLAFSFSMVALYAIGNIGILTYNLDQRRRVADELLLNILPRPVAEQLKYSPNQIIAQQVPQASVLFADLANFTPISAKLTASEVLELLNEVFSYFDALVEQRGLEKIKTIGDCYMVAAGVPQPLENHAGILADLALEIQEYMRTREFKGRKLAFRIGISSGPLVAGVIGHKKFAYDLWGDTVNTASRMESHGAEGFIQITDSTYNLIKDDFVCEPRGVIDVKGKGEMKIWYVLGKRI